MATTGYLDVPSRSPWIAQLAPDGPPRPLVADVTADVAVVGAGIAGIATAFFLLRDTDATVVLLERDRVGRGATGRNAGQLTTYFERPLHDLAAEFGIEQAAQGQRAFDEAHSLLDLIVRESGASVRIERFTGHMGMLNLNHVLVHLRNNQIRRQGGVREEECVVSEEAEFLAEIPDELRSFYTVVPQSTVDELLEVPDSPYRAVLSDLKGCANSGALVQQVLRYLESTYPERLQYADHTKVDLITVMSEGVDLDAAGHGVHATRVVMCTNGFVDHRIVESDGTPVGLDPDQQVGGRIGYMAAFVEEEMRTPTAMSYIRNAVIGGNAPYVYVTRRTYDRPGDIVTLTCMGGPEYPIGEGEYEPTAPYPAHMLEMMDESARPFAQPSRPPRQPYDFAWHGLMGYNDGGVRVIGPHPMHPAVMYNLGCNGVGFLPSVFGGDRISRMIRGEELEPSMFDPRPAR